MCNQPTYPKNPDKPALSRRKLLQGALGLAVSAGLASFSGMSFAAVLTQAERDKMSPDDVLALLLQGNRRFRTGKTQQHNYLAQKIASTAGQYPAATILSCIDSRVPAEILLDMRLGEAFNTRVAGNICNNDIVGGLEFSCALAGAKLILVMGHTNCGAVKGAIDNLKLGKLSGLLEQIKPAQRATQYSGERSSQNIEFVDAVAVNNVRHSMDEIRRRSPLLTKLEQQEKIKIVGSMYHFNGGNLEVLDW